MASSAPVSDVKLHGRSDITWASTWASLNTGTETCSGRFNTTGRDVALRMFGTIGLSLRLGFKMQSVRLCATSSKTSWMARWRKRQEWWNKFPSVALMLFAEGAAPTQNSLRPNWSKNSTKFVRKTKTRSFSIWVLSVGQYISNYAARMGRSLICWYWWKTKEITHDSTRPNP